MESKTIIGARSLSEKEIIQILPTYQKIFEQIDEFRNSKNSDDENVQKTNNIGILGSRGSGKTSVLKTISKRMKKEGLQDIILPIIIPENMSESSTLMATILGLFKTIVDDMVGKNDDKYKNCMYDKEDELKQKYNEAIKQYVFIQNDYRKILMNQFTTENEYVKKINKVLNSDIEFINKFNEFIKVLIDRRRKYVESKQQPLIFIFIDDIDLSTTRCSDVVKTLLSYLSNGNIVTIISGDLDTFEEALTIEFLRQENALNKEVMTQKYLGNAENLLQRKKILAYEYLKKVIPPTYRHNIKYWSLATKANYSIHMNNEKVDDKTTLGELLVVVLEKYIGKSFFKFIEYGDGELIGKEYNLPYTYNLFDHTSRGLNNIYNMLIQIKDKRKEENKEIDYSDKKLLIEAITASNRLYNSFRTELFENIIQFGENEESTIIKWDNLTYLLGLNTENYEIGDLIDQKVLSEKEKSLSGKDKFSMFIFVYFAAKLMNKYDNKLTELFDLKKKIINILINNPEVSENLIKLERSIELKEDKSSPSGNYYTFNILSRFLYKSDFEVTLILYKYLSNYNFDLSVLDDTNINNRTAYRRSINIRSIWFALRSYCQTMNINPKDYIAKIYSDFIMEFSYIQSCFSGEERKYILERTTGKTLNNISSSILAKSRDMQSKEIRDDEINEYSKLIINSIDTYWGDKIFVKNNSIVELTKLTYEEFTQNYKGNTDDSKDEFKRYNIIYNISKNNLWEQSLSFAVTNYLETKIHNYITKIFKQVSEIRINISKFKNNSYMNFESIYKGSYWTIANITNRNIEEIVKEKEFLNLDDYRQLKGIILSLAMNKYVWYGQKQAQNMLNELVNNSFIEVNDEVKEDHLLNLYIKYFMVWKYENQMERESKEIKQFIETVSDAQIINSNNEINKFMNIINVNSDESNKIEVNEFEELFSARG